MRFDILSIFPEMFDPFIDYGIIGRAVKKGKIEVNIVNIRDFGVGPHLMTDDRPFGGGDGMVMKPEPIFQALESIPKARGDRKVLMLTPQGQLFNQSLARNLSELEQIILVCGRYEGVDERVRTRYIDMELSIGDYILSGGELPAMIVVESVSRLIPGVLGGSRSNLEESFENYLLEYPQYTRPRVFQGEEVPSVLLSGNHEKIKNWRKIQSIKRTLERRPDLLKKACFNEMEKSVVQELTTKSGKTLGLVSQEAGPD
ncbi:MAG TPA: tRNA (guanosine(37)-N1)-methyltransferase TrmD [Desulfatiglandales bacterium]|nr:tRNA (guanosine(37)-N1)-methyltransferase TrmD [Desulfatiglandales bacterium]